MDMAVGDILLELCKLKQVQIQTALRSFQGEGLALLFGEQQRVGLMSVVRGESAIIMRCQPMRLMPSHHPTFCLWKPVSPEGWTKDREHPYHCPDAIYPHHHSQLRSSPLQQNDPNHPLWTWWSPHMPSWRKASECI